MLVVACVAWTVVALTTGDVVAAMVAMVGVAVRIILRGEDVR